MLLVGPMKRSSSHAREGPPSLPPDTPSAGSGIAKPLGDWAVYARRRLGCIGDGKGCIHDVV